MKYTLTDLFSGAGLMSAGFMRAGFEPVLALDVDACAVASYNRNVRSVAQVRNVRDMAGARRTDVLIAGPPCQGFSTLGRRDPSDKRNKLSLAVADWAKETRAKIVVIENVPPFLGSKFWSRMARRLVSLGYEIDTWVLDAVQFGVAQHRTRSFTIASRVGLPSPPIRTAAMPRTVRMAFADLKHRRNDPLHLSPPPSDVAKRRIALVPPKGDKRDLMRVAPRDCPPSWFRIGVQATDAWGRMDPDAPANTLRCSFQNPSKGRYIHPSEDRVITLREGARLQGVPDDWLFVGDRYPIARQIGNGVPVPLAAAVALKIRQAFS